MQLTQYDEYPIHQAPYPFSRIPSTDFAWDEGYAFFVSSADARIQLVTGMRVTPNADSLGGHAGINIDGVQRTLRLSRTWRQNCDTHLGPLRIRFVEPFKDIHLTLEDNPSGLTFDLRWLGLAPAHLISRHIVLSRDRPIIDQTRYNQVGRAEGWMQVEGRRFSVETVQWMSARDHKWGLFEGRVPLSQPPAQFLPPPELPPLRPALRTTMFMVTDAYSAHFHLREDDEGRQVQNDAAFGVPFEGAIDRGWGERIAFTEVTHQFDFKPGSSAVQCGTFRLRDAQGGSWVISFDVTAPPHVVVPVGYQVGGWKDGGNIHTYHGPANPYMEWDEFDFSKQPCSHTPYGQSEPRQVSGVLHIARIRCVAPDGSVAHGQALIEVMRDGRYKPYGFEAPNATAYGSALPPTAGLP